MAAPGFSPAQSLKILVAEDMEILRIGLRRLLESIGHQVDAVCNGREAIEAAKLRDYDLILLDLQMPEIGGIEVALHLNAKNRAKPSSWLVAMSGENTSAISLVAAGFDRFLAKPVRLEELKRLAAEITAVSERLSRWTTTHPDRVQVRPQVEKG